VQLQPQNWFAPSDGNRSRLYLGNDFAARSRAAPEFLWRGGERKGCHSNYAATIAVMALFTVVLEFGGGTYISQFKAASAHAAAIKHAAHLISIKGMSTPSDRKRLAESLSLEQPIAIQGIRSVWCCSASVGRKFALVNIVATA
jgi:hypothetical protein